MLLETERADTVAKLFDTGSASQQRPAGLAQAELQKAVKEVQAADNARRWCVGRSSLKARVTEH
jgi:hypothetical protein